MGIPINNSKTDYLERLKSGRLSCKELRHFKRKIMGVFGFLHEDILASKALERMVSKGFVDNTETAKEVLGGLTDKDLYFTDHKFLRITKHRLPQSGDVYSFSVYDNTIIV